MTVDAGGDAESRHALDGRPQVLRGHVQADGFFFRERNDRVLVERNDAYAQQHMTVDRDGG